MQFTDLQWQDITRFVVILLLSCGAYLTIHSVRKAQSETAKAKQQPMDEVREKLAADKARLDAHDKAIERLQRQGNAQEGQLKLILRSQLALLRHGVDGNNIDGLRASQRDIQDYLVDK